MADELTPAQQEARDVIHDRIQQSSAILGPEFDGDSRLEPGSQPQGPVFLDGWVLMANWVDSEGEGFLTRITSKHLQTHSRVGMLHEGLYGFDD